MPATRPGAKGASRTPSRLRGQEGGRPGPSRARGGTTRLGAGGARRSASAAGERPRPTGRWSLSLGMKFALLVGGLIAVVVLFWGWAISSIARSSLEQRIIRDGAVTLKAVALYGRLLLEGKEGATHKDLESLAAKGTELFDVVISGPDASGQKVTYTMRGPGRGYGLGAAEDIDMDLGIGIRVSSTFVVINKRRGVPVIDLSDYRIRGSGGADIGTARVLIDASRVSDVLGGLRLRIAGLGMVFLAIGVAASFFLGAQIAKPAKVLIADMERVAQGDYEHGTQAVSGDEIGKIADQFNHMTQALRELREKGKDAERLGLELDAASEIQASLLPSRIPSLPGYDVFPFYRSAKEVGGDYYDFFPIDREKLAMVVADVSGKGIPGSMVMATTRTTLRILGPECGTAAETLRQTNKLVAKDMSRGMFVTVIFAMLNVRAREMTVCSAGHNPMVIYRERTGKCDLVNPAGIALGFDKGPVFDRTLKDYSTRLELGDRVVMYTDGVVEAMNENQDEYGDQRFYEFVRDHARMRSKDFALAVVRDIERHRGAAEQHDDITISTFRVMT